ncbi:type I secretion system permease/ATPase [Qipengyuania sp. XHP0207]|uniref:type I secretion system permease/ATPase n=1 Tax=Qipengyuania sp. XHP0207 TaxID=3038078 RepID=UPI00241F9083|nr:type I secretion system permease/ATPase [Qipengyuania sp. XHP0207]MDG5747689.1 type I secretion system permease/ATPase [Qipengyuania sp. XHP0207]
MSEDTLVEVPQKRLADWLVEPIKANWRTYAKVAIAATLINLFALVTALFTMTVYDRVIPNSAFTSLAALSIGLGIVIIFDFALKLLRAYFVDHAGMNIDKDIGATVFERLIEMRLELRKGSTGQLTGLMRELETLRDFFASATLAAVVDVPFIVITLVVVALIGGWVVLVPALMVPLVILVGLAAHPTQQRLAAKAMDDGLLKQSVLVETIGSIEAVKTAGARNLFENRWTRALDDHAQISLQQRLISSIATTFATSAGTISYAGVIVVGVFSVADNRLTMGGLIACSILAGRAIAPLAQISQLVSRLVATRTAYRQIRTLMERPPEGPGADAIVVQRTRGEIELRNVTFQYPGAATKALDSVSLTIAPGEKVALLGRVGSGKSTLARMMLGLYPPQDGMVLFDGIDIAQLDPDSLRRSVGSVLQEPALFSGTIRENIGLGRAAVDDEEMLRAARISGTDLFASRIPRGYDLRLVDRGEGLSGGQRQSIAIARALAGRPPVLVMDEPSSAMDAQTEADLITRLKDELDDRTLVVVTHRQPLLALVDRIIVIDEGKVVADGPRDAVLAKLAEGSRQKSNPASGTVTSTVNTRIGKPA